MKKTWPVHVLGGQYESPEPRTGVFDEFNMIKMEFEVTIGFYRMGVCLIFKGRFLKMCFSSYLGT